MKYLFRLILIFTLLLPSFVSAKEIKGINLPDSIEAASTQLILNGVGLRSKFIFTVYAGGLYLTQLSQDESAIIKADVPMMIRMHFIYDGVSAEKLQTAWKDGFALTAPNADKALQEAMAAFTTMFTVEAKKNDIYDIIWLPGKGVEVRFNDKVLGMISGLDFKQALFGIWLGKQPVDAKLKEGMLGR